MVIEGFAFTIFRIFQKFSDTREYNLFQHTFDSEARKIFKELITNQDLFIRFLQQSVKGIYEVTIMLTNGDFVSDILISRYMFLIDFEHFIFSPNALLRE